MPLCETERRNVGLVVMLFLSQERHGSILTKYLTTVGLVLLCATSASAQTKRTPAEQEAWANNPQAGVLESSPCKQVTWLLEGEENLAGDPLTKQPVRHALGWWGRGFIEGAVYMVPGEKGEKVTKAATDFGLSVDVVASHISTYCYGHQTETPYAAIQGLLLTILKTVP